MNTRAWGSKLLIAYLSVFVAFMLSPLIYVVFDSFNAAEYRGASFSGVTLKWYGDAFSEPAFRTGFLNSVLVGVVATAGAVGVGTLASIGLVRYRFPGRELLRGLFLSPMVFPRVALGLGAYILFLRVASELGLRGLILGSPIPMMLVHMLLGLPIVILLVSATLLALDPSVEEAAQDLGATPVQTFSKVTLPLIKSSVVASSIFAFMFSFDEVETSFFLAPLGMRTLPIEMFLFLERDLTPTLSALSTLMLVVTFLGVAVFLLTQGAARLARLGASE
jgi:putative spermidine/putrescine transport system permease protein